MVKQSHLPGIPEDVVFVASSTAIKLLAGSPERLASTIRWGQIAKYKQVAGRVHLKLLQGPNMAKNTEVVFRAENAPQLFESIRARVTKLTASQAASSKAGDASKKKSMAKQKDSQGRCTVRPRRMKDGELEKGTNPRSRSDKTSLVDLYGLLYARVPFTQPSDAALAKEFSDKELRVLMGMNKMLINDFDPVSGKYTEKTKQSKIRSLLPHVHELQAPDKLREPAKPKRRPRNPALPGPADGGSANKPGPRPSNASASTTKPSKPKAAALAAANVSKLQMAPMGQPRTEKRSNSQLHKYAAEQAARAAAARAAAARAAAMARLEEENDSSDSDLSGGPSEPDTPVCDPGDMDGMGTTRSSYGNFDFVAAYTPSAAKIVTTLPGLQLGEREVAQASGYVCASVAQHFAQAVVQGTSVSANLLPAVINPGIDTFRRTSTDGEGKRMDAVITDSFLGDALRIIDIRAFSRSLRYPSNLGIVVEQLEKKTSGSMIAFLYGHRNFRRARTTGTVLFVGYAGAKSDKQFVLVDPRCCAPDTGLPNRDGGNPVMIQFTNKTELRQHLEFLLRGEGGDDLSSVDWQASFLEVVPDQEEEVLPTTEAGTDDESMWLPEWDERCAMQDLLLDTMDTEDSVLTPSSDAASSPSSMSSPAASSSDDDNDDPASPQPRGDGMSRSFSFEDLEAVLPDCTSPALTDDVQLSIDQECRKQADEMAWQTEMNAKVLRSRQEHERRRRQQLQHDGLTEDPDDEEENEAISREEESDDTFDTDESGSDCEDSATSRTRRTESELLVGVTASMNQFEAAGAIYARQMQIKTEKRLIAERKIVLVKREKLGSKHGSVPSGENRKRRVSIGAQLKSRIFEKSSSAKKHDRKPSPPKRVANPYAQARPPAFDQRGLQQQPPAPPHPDAPARRQISPAQTRLPWQPPTLVIQPGSGKHVAPYKSNSMPISLNAADKLHTGFATMSVTPKQPVLNYHPLPGQQQKLGIHHAALPGQQVTRFEVSRDGNRMVKVDVSPTGITIHDDAMAEPHQFLHLTSIQSWRTIREGNVPSGPPVGLRLQLVDQSEIGFGTLRGREISDCLMQYAQGLESLMHSGMHVRGSAMVN